MKMSEICTLDTVGERIKAIRKLNNLSREKFAKKLITSVSVVGRWERNEQDLKAEEIIKISKLFNISCDALLLGVMPRQSDITRITGLDQKSIRWLNKTKKGNKSLLQTINIVLSSPQIAKALFECIDVYSHIIIPKVVEYDDGSRAGRLSTYFADEEALLKVAMSEQIFEVLEFTRKAYYDKRCNIYESREKEYISDLKELLSKITIATEEFEPKALRDLTFDEDEII